MRSRYAVVLAAVAVVAVAVIVFLTRGPSSSSPSDNGVAGATAGHRFFSGYVNRDGRVVRRDQGGDTVSEGQSYAMQIALAERDAVRFELVWRWTKAHLQRDDGLVSWRWSNGHVTDAQPAADADVDIAVALARAAVAFKRPDYRDDARRIAATAADQETFAAGGRTLLAAGPWAVGDRIVNPSYLAPCDYAELLAATGDARWRQLADGSLSLFSDMLEQGLPPDWAVIDPSGAARPIGGPDDRSGAGRYGLDAARVLARLAACAEGRPLAQRMWPRLRDLDGAGAAVAYSLDGERLDGDTNPLGLVAAALAAHTSHDDGEATRLLDRAENMQSRHATYYGAAWLALGEQLLEGPAGLTDAGGNGRRVRLLSATAFGPAQVPTTTVPPATTAPADPTTAPSTTATTAPMPTTTTPTTTPTTTATTAVAPTSTTALPTTVMSPTTAAPARAPVAGPTSVAGTTIPPAADASAGVPGSGDTNPAAAPGGPDTPVTSAEQQPSGSGSDHAGADLISPPTGLDPLLPSREDARASVQSSAERSRRRTAGVTIGGFAGIAAVGASLGLRERRLLRRRLPG